MSVLFKNYVKFSILFIVVISNNAFSEWDFRGTPNAWESTPMTDLGDNIYSVEVRFEKQEDSARFKIDRFGDWLESYPAQDYIVDDCAQYEITFDASQQLISVEKLTDLTSGLCDTSDSWFVRSSASLWEPIEMNAVEGTTEFQIEIAFEMQEEIPRFKIDHFGDWLESYPEEDYLVEECTLYNIVFESTSKTIEVTAIETITTGLCETPVDAWNLRGTANEWIAESMTALDSGLEFEITVDFKKEEPIARFKIDHFGDWVESYPAEDFVVDECSTYHILFNANDFTIEATKVAEITTGECEVLPVQEWNFRGTANNWVTTPLAQIEESQQYEITVAFKKQEANARFKIDRFGDWFENYPENDYIVDDCSEYRIEFNAETQDIVVEKLADIVGGACNQEQNTVGGDLRIISINIDEIDGRTRTVRVLLPLDYDTSDKHYPTLYMHDGHNMFDQSTSAFGQEWSIDETLNALFNAEETSGVIVVAIDSASSDVERNREYTNWDWTDPGLGEIDAIGELHADFVVNTLIPTINNRYRTLTGREHIGIGGSGLGGYMSIFTGIRHQSIFSKIASVSTLALDEPMAGFKLREMVEQADSEFLTRVYLDIGSNENLPYAMDPQLLIDSNNQMCAAFTTAGFEDAACRTIDGGTHNEGSWGARFGEIFMYLYEGQAR